MTGSAPTPWRSSHGVWPTTGPVSGSTSSRASAPCPSGKPPARPICTVRPSTITKLYRDLLTSGGRDGQPLAVATVTHLHAVLRKAFRDAVVVDELIGSNPVERAKRPRAQAHEPGTIWTVAQLRAVPGHSQAAPTVHLLPRRRLHRSPPWRGTNDGYLFTTGGHRRRHLRPGRQRRVAPARSRPGTPLLARLLAKEPPQ